MKTTFLLALALTISTAHADSTLPEARKAAFLSSHSCDSAIRSDEQHIYIGYGAYPPHAGETGVLQIIDIAHPESQSVIQTKEGVVDVQAVGNRLFVLTFSTIEEWNLSTLTFTASYPVQMQDTAVGGQELNYKEHATGFYYFDHQFFISHGRLGFSVFDIKKNQLTDQQRLLTEQLPMESMAIGIAGTGDRAILVMDNFSPPLASGKRAFRGFVVLDLKSHTVVQKGGEMDPGAESVNLIDGSVIVGFHPPIWKFNLKDILKTSKAQPIRIVYHFPGTHGIAEKQLFFDEKYMYACFGHKPTVLDRKEINLD